MDNSSRAETYVQSKNWPYTIANNEIVTTCPLCAKDKHLYIHYQGEKDGLWKCHHCGEQGNLYELGTRLGDRVPDIVSLKEGLNVSQGLEPLPNFDLLHQALMASNDALEYCIGRGWSMAIIKEMKIGFQEKGNKKWLVFPYFQKGKSVFAKYRTLPPDEKDFRASEGRDCPLYNASSLAQGHEELIFTEGEGDTLSLLSYGFANSLGVPGAGIHKTLWVTEVDRAAPKKLFLLFDVDQAGQKGAHEMAMKLGIEKCFNVLLPEFEIDGHKGKDIGEWFLAGNTADDLRALMAQARPFDVAGVSGVVSVLDELDQELLGRGIEPTFTTPWPSLNAKLGGAEPGDLIGILASAKHGKSTMMLNWLSWYAQNGTPSLMYCQEMHPRRLVRKWACHVTGVDDTPGKSQFGRETIKKAKEIAIALPADLLFGFTHGHRPDHVFEVMTQAVRRYGIKVIGFDNLQLLSRSITNQVAELNVLGKRFKTLAMELNVLVILIIQPNRIRAGEIAAAENAFGSSSIEKDVDAMICLHRNRIAKIKADDFNGFLDSEENFEPAMLCRVDLSRYSAGGCCTLFLNGGTSSVREFAEDERQAQILQMPSATVNIEA